MRAHVQTDTGRKNGVSEISGCVKSGMIIDNDIQKNKERTTYQSSACGRLILLYINVIMSSEKEMNL